jgi:hypothetical protein
MPKNKFGSKKISLSRGVAVRALDEVDGIDDISTVLKELYRFEILATLHHLGWIDAPYSEF